MSFIHDDFLLNNDYAKQLYHGFAEDLPIIDYHCHLTAQEIVENKPFKNLTEMWLYGDHYKWRAMRSAGIDERYITGDASDYEKFQAWAKTVPQCIGNPLYHWTHLELKRYFDLDLLLNEETCEDVWEHCNRILEKGTLTPQSIIKDSKVQMIGTTDGPLDDLAYHKMIRDSEEIDVKVLPSFRPDPAFEINKEDFIDFVKGLSEVTGQHIETFEQYLKALKNRVHFFNEVGAKISDHGFEALLYEPCSLNEAATIFSKRAEGARVTPLEEAKFKTYIMVFLGKLYAELGWVMQLHIGALRDNNTRMYNKIGPNTGFDSIGDAELAKPLNGFLNELDQKNKLPKTILYNVNPIYNYVVATAAGNFQSEGIKGKIQFGAGWWFNDQKNGMLRQLNDLADIGLLSTFVGMLTDSRSILSYTRHEYFRRILCNLFGEWMDQGEIPQDLTFIGNLVKAISFENANIYFGLAE